MPNIGEFGTRPYQESELIERDPDFGRVVCFCERVTRGEIDAALASPIPPADLDGAAAPHPGADGPLPGLLLRRGGGRALGRLRRRLDACDGDRMTGPVVVGGGPAGLAAAIELRRLGDLAR